MSKGKHDISVLPGYAAANDKAAFVLSCAALFGPTELHDLTAQRLRELARLSNETSELAEVELALAYYLRERSTGSVQESQEQIDKIFRETSSPTSRVSGLYRLLRSAIKMSPGRDYATARMEAKRLADEFSASDDHLLYALSTKVVGDASLHMGLNREAERSYTQAIGVFDRYKHSLLAAYTRINTGMLSYNMSRFSVAAAQMKDVLTDLENLDALSLQIPVYVNLGNAMQYVGDWSSSYRYLRRALDLRAEVFGDAVPNGIDGHNVFTWCDTQIEWLQLAQRDFDTAQTGLKKLVEKYAPQPSGYRLLALCKEFLGEIELEKGNYKTSIQLFDEAYDLIIDRLPGSDVMAEVLRRRSDAYQRRGDLAEARADVLRCIRLCKQIGDRYELAASLRILGNIHVAERAPRKAQPCYETSIRISKAIGESYEVMRTQLAYGRFLIDQGHADAEIHLLESRQNCKKLELDYFACLVAIELARFMTQNDNHDEARVRLAEAEELYDKLNRYDQAQARPLLEKTRETLDSQVIRAGMDSAEELKNMCRVYADARFPMDDARADLSYQVAQSVGAESLFLVRRHARGYEVPIAYNVPKKEARETVRRLDRDKSVALLGVDGQPRSLRLLDSEKTLVCVPGHDGFTLCVVFQPGRRLQKRHYEMLVTGVTALERVANEILEPAPKVDEAFVKSMPRGALVHPRGSFKEILTVDRELIKVIHLAERAASGDAPILLQGETGVGKELFARAIHEASRRADKPFVAINAGGMPVQLLESQLFGHRRGSFTDAVADQTGFIEEAQGGTLFLDEVGEMGEELQVKLLRLLESGEYRPLGEAKSRKADVRVISATNRELLTASGNGRFRSDLFYRLGAVRLTIPPLRFRQNDVQLLTRHFIRECAVRNGLRGRAFQFDVKAVEALQLYDWPGNVRELHNEMLRITSLIGADDMIRFGMLSDTIKSYVSRRHKASGLLEKTLEDFERRMILESLEKHDWNRVHAAADMGVPRTTLIDKMRRLNIAPRPQ